MAILCVNEEPVDLPGFRAQCGKCGSENVVVNIDYGLYPGESWLVITMRCQFCGLQKDYFEA